MLRKLTMIVMGIFLVLCAGSCNIYPLYLKLMMDKYNFSLREVNSFGSSINLGLWVAFTMGFVYDKYGPKFSCILGALLLSGSYVVLYFILTSSIKSISIVFFILIGLLMGQGSALCYTTAITTNLKNFKIKETSIIVGLLVANMAISPSIFTTYKEYLENVNIANYFLLISIFLAIIILICGVVFTNIKNLYSDESKLMDYQKYKEKNVIFLLLILNFITLIIYIFGVMFNYSNSNSSFPNFIVYPCLQSLNFVFLILEKLKVFDYFYFREFINKEVNKKIILEDVNYQNEINLRKLAEDKSINDNNENKQEENNKTIHLTKITEKPEISLESDLEKKNFDYNENNEENIIKESNLNVDAFEAKEISMHLHQQPKQGKTYKNTNNDKQKSARNFNLDIKNKYGIYPQFNSSNNFSVDYKYENVNKNRFDLDKNQIESFVDNNINIFNINNNAENDFVYNNKKLNTTVGEVFHQNKLQLEKIEEKNFANLNLNKTNANFNLEKENVFSKTARRSFAGENFKMQKKTSEIGKFEILDEESKDNSISQNENSFELKRNKDYSIKQEISIKNNPETNLKIQNQINENTNENKNNKNLENNNKNNKNLENKSFNSNDNLQNSQAVNSMLQSSSSSISCESEYRKFIRLVTSKEVSILFTILVLGVGSVIGNLNNIEFIVSSISKTTSRSDIFEYSILYFSFNSLSRLVSGIIIDKLILQGKIFFFLLAASLFGLFSQVLGILMTKEYLVISICLAGSVHGALLTFAPIYTKNFFDLNDMGKILGFLTTGAAIGSVFVGNIIFTIFYEVFKKDDVCKGQRCFRYSYVITTVLFLVNIGLSLYLMSIMSKRLKKKKEDDIKISNEIERKD